MAEIQGPSISIIIRTKNEERFIGQTLSAVFEQDTDLPFEVIIIDSGSTDHTLEIVRQFNVRVYEIKPEEFTYGFALNYGVRLAKGEYIINLSHDCVPVSKKWLMNMLRPILEDSSIVATFGRQEPVKGLNPFEEQDLLMCFKPDLEGRIEIVFSNSNCAIRKRVLIEYPFDEKTCFAEDFIWAKKLPPELRIKYVHDASVYHSHRLDFQYWSKRFYNNGFFIPYLEKKHGLKWYGDDPLMQNLSNKTNPLKIVHLLIGESISVITFLKKNMYFRFIPFAPIFVALRRHYYVKGIVDGKKIWRL